MGRLAIQISVVAVFLIIADAGARRRRRPKQNFEVSATEPNPNSRYSKNETCAKKSQFCDTVNEVLCSTCWQEDRDDKVGICFDDPPGEEEFHGKDDVVGQAYLSWCYNMPFVLEGIPNNKTEQCHWCCQYSSIGTSLFHYLRGTLRDNFCLCEMIRYDDVSRYITSGSGFDVIPCLKEKEPKKCQRCCRQHTSKDSIGRLAWPNGRPYDECSCEFGPQLIIRL